MIVLDVCYVIIMSLLSPAGCLVFLSVFCFFILFIFFVFVLFFFQAEDGIRDLVRSRGLGDVYKRQTLESVMGNVLPINTIAIALGMHCRCGIEDAIYDPHGNKMGSVLSLIHI